MATQFPTYTPDAAVIAYLQALEARMNTLQAVEQTPTLVEQGYGSGAVTGQTGGP